MALNTSKILDLTCDEITSNKLYDYSQSRKDAELVADNNGDFPLLAKGNRGNAIEFNGNNYAKIDSLDLLNLSGNFTLFFDYYCKKAVVGTATEIIVILNHSGLSETGESLSVQESIDVLPETWQSIVFIKNGTEYKLYLNGNLQKTITDTKALLGISFNQNFLSEYAFAKIDNVEIFNTAFTDEEIENHNASNISNKIDYLIDDIDIRSVYGVHIERSRGVVNKPKFKEFASIEWGNYHGEDVDLNNKYYEARNIELDCWLRAENQKDFLDKILPFIRLFEKSGTQTLRINNIMQNKPLLYKVYCKDEIDVEKAWRPGLMYGTFTLKLVEPQPVKRILSHIMTNLSNATSQISFYTEKYVDVDWGDGNIDYDCWGQVNLTHKYEKQGQYYIIITGCIEEITNFQSDDIVIWNRL